MHSTILASEPLSKLKFWNLKLHLTQLMLPNVLDFDIRRGAVVVWPKSLALYLDIVNTTCLSVSDAAEKQSDYALGDNSTLVRLWQIIPCTDFTLRNNYQLLCFPVTSPVLHDVHCSTLQFGSHVYSSPPPLPPPQATSWFLIIRRQGNGPLHRITGWFLEEANFSLLCTCAKTPWKQVNEDDIGDNLLWTLFAL